MSSVFGDFILKTPNSQLRTPNLELCLSKNDGINETSIDGYL